MKYEEAMSGAEKIGTERRNRKRLVYRKVTWGLGNLSIIAALIWLPAGPLQTYVQYKGEHPHIARSEEARVAAMGSIAPAGCTRVRPCALTLRPDGRTQTVAMNDGQQVCFDPSFWANLKRLGYWTSYHYHDARRYGCTADQVLAGKCAERLGTEFWFTPENGVPLPEYWISSNGSTC